MTAPERLTEWAMRYLAWRSTAVFERELDGDRGQEGRHRRWSVGLRTGDRGVAGQAWRERRGAGPAAVEGARGGGRHRRHVPRGGRHRLRRHRAGAAAGGRRARRSAHRGDHRRRRHRRAHHQEGRAAQPGFLPQDSRSQPHRLLQHQPAGGLADEQERSRRRRGRGARRHHQHRIHRRVRGTDRAGRLHRIEGRDRGHVPHDGPRSGQPRHPRAGDRAEPVRHRADRGDPRRVRQAAHQGRGVPEAARQARRIRKLALAIVENPMLNGQCIRLDAGQRFAPK